MNTDGFPRRFARTRRFSLGVPHRFTVSPDGDRVLFVRSVSGTVPRGLLWMHQDGRERLLADPAAAEGAEPGGADPAGVVSYATDRRVRTVAYAVGGELWTVRTDGGPPRRLPAAGPVRDPRPSPDGTLIAYVAEGALRVIRTDGTQDRPLAEPEAPEVTYGLADHTAVSSIGRTRGHWWSPEGTALLVARVDTSTVARRYLADPSDPGRPPRAVPRPTAGTAVPRTSLHLVAVDGGHTPVRLPRRVPDEHLPDGGWGPAFEYVIAAGWQGVGPVVALQSRDQRTVWVLRVDAVTGSAEPLARRSDEHWVEFPPGTPLHTDSGTPVLPEVRGDVRTLRIGGVSAPDGLQVRAVLGAVGERVLFTASREPTEVHVWSYEPGQGFERLTREPGVHTAAAGGDTLVLDGRTPDGHTVAVLRGGKPAGRIAVLAERPPVAPRPVPLVLTRRRLRGQLFLPSWYEPGSDGLPVLLSPYAGPAMQVVTRAHGWHAAVCRWFAERGFAVLVTDGRGTPGRGVRWQRAVLGDRLAPVLADQIDALHAAAERYDALDVTRVGIRGWSFGGYLAAGAVLRRPDVFHAAVAGAPPTDRRLYDAYWEERFLGHPDLHPEGYERSSLLPLAGGLSRPLLLVHGLADDNVAPAHTLRLSRALLAAGRPHSVLLLPGVGHLVDREGEADTLLRLQLGFLKDALGA
ncbi:MAG TPA: prolyl oligopeptidase family serine peptidase [Streptomyces sp.]|nr:prolyl oligopeptidase family serine peptidase [Streptomyces sp.]